MAEIIADLHNEIPDAELMKRYGGSLTGLKRFLDELLKAVSYGSRHIEVEANK